MDSLRDFELVANGDPSAVEFACVVFKFLHEIDDAWDMDQPLSKEFFVRTMLEMVVVLAKNHFWLAHRSALFGLLQLAFLGWEAGDEWKARTGHDRVAAEVIKSAYKQILWFVAVQCHGLDGARAVKQQLECFNYDLEDSNVLPAPQYV